MSAALRRLFAIVILSISCYLVYAQSADNSTQYEISAKKTPKPYKVITSGKQITIKSSKDIQHVMLWTSNGHRVIEQKEINAASFSFTIPVNDKIFFLMVGTTDGKIYTEKIGVQ